MSRGLRISALLLKSPMPKVPRKVRVTQVLLKCDKFDSKNNRNDSGFINTADLNFDDFTVKNQAYSMLQLFSMFVSQLNFWKSTLCLAMTTLQYKD